MKNLHIMCGIQGPSGTLDFPNISDYVPKDLMCVLPDCIIYPERIEDHHIFLNVAKEKLGEKYKWALAGINNDRLFNVRELCDNLHLATNHGTCIIELVTKSIKPVILRINFAEEVNKYYPKGDYKVNPNIEITNKSSDLKKLLCAISTVLEKKGKEYFCIKRQLYLIRGFIKTLASYFITYYNTIFPNESRRVRVIVLIYLHDMFLYTHNKEFPIYNNCKIAEYWNGEIIIKQEKENQKINESTLIDPKNNQIIDEDPEESSSEFVPIDNDPCESLEYNSESDTQKKKERKKKRNK